MIPLRIYQERALAGLRESLRNGARAPILVAPTGSGKTVMASAVTHGAVSRGKRVLFLAHRFELVEQASMKLASYGLQQNIIAPPSSCRQIAVNHFRAMNRSFVNQRALVSVGTIQTKARRLDGVFEKPDIIIIDECHLSIAPTYQKVVQQFPEAVLIGLTATPTRLDGKGLGKHAGGLYDDLVVLCQPTELVEEGFLVPPRFFAAREHLSMKGAHKVRGDWDQKELDERVNKPKLIGDAVSHYRQVAHGRPAMAFCATIDHAEKTAEAFRAAGYRAVAVSGETDPAVRAKAVAGLGDGTLDVVCNCALYVEGLDQPAISCILLLTQTLSLTRFMQKVGRGLRPHPGKDDCIILDHGGNVFIHGHPLDDREWTLDGLKKRPRAANDNEPVVSIQTCPKCYTITKPMPRCPTCGHVFEARDRKLEVQEGNLVELTPEMRAQIRIKAEAEKRAQQKQRKTEEGQCKTLEDFIELGRSRGYNFPEAWGRKRFAFRKQRRA